MSWPTYQLDELGSVNRGKSRHRPRNAPHLYGGPYPFVQTSDVKNANLYLTSFEQTYSAAGLAQSKLWDEGTLCITIAANIADTTILGIKACFPDSIIGFIADPRKADVRFIKYYFDHHQRQFQQISQGSTQDNLSAEKLLSIKIPAPPLPTQKKIAGVLSAYDDLIEANLKRITLLEEMAQITYEEWFVRRRFPGFETTPTNPATGLPEGWAIKFVKDVGEVVTGKTPSTTDQSLFGNDVPFIKTPDMHGHPYVISSEQSLSMIGADSQKKKYLPKNSLMVSCIGTVGVVALTAIPSQTNQQINSVVFHDPKFAFYMFAFAKRLKPLLEGLGSNGATMTNVNKSKFEEIEVYLPPDVLIKHFNDIAIPSFETILNLMHQNALLKEARDLLLPRLMTGLIDIDDYLARNGQATVAA